MTTCEHTWPYMTIQDHIWPYMTIHDHTWPWMTINDNEWPWMTMQDHTWPCMTLHDSRRPYIAIHDPTLTHMTIMTIHDHTHPSWTINCHTRLKRAKCHSLCQYVTMFVKFTHIELPTQLKTQDWSRKCSAWKAETLLIWTNVSRTNVA